MIRLFDAHVHFWDPTQRHHDWLADAPALRRRFGPGDLDSGSCELSGVVFVQADCRDDEALEEALWVSRLAETHSLVRGIVAYAPLHRGADVADHLDAVAAVPLVVGVRRLLQGEPTAALADPELVTALRLLPDFGLTFDLCATHDQLPAAAALVRACPETRFVLDHLGKPPVARALLDPWRADIARIAELPNVVCKLSGLTTEATDHWSPEELLPYLTHALESFGATRCMFASDWPVATLRGTYQEWADVVLASISTLGPSDRDAVLGGTAAMTYGVTELNTGNGGTGDASSAIRG